MTYKMYLHLENVSALQISGSKASSWLGLDSDSDGSHDQGDNDNDKSDHLVTVKPHFEGKAGEQVSFSLFADFFATWSLQSYVQHCKHGCAVSQVLYII